MAKIKFFNAFVLKKNINNTTGTGIDDGAQIFSFGNTYNIQNGNGPK